MTRRDARGGRQDRLAAHSTIAAGHDSAAPGTKAIDVRAALEGSSDFHFGRPYKANPWHEKNAPHQHASWKVGWLEARELDYRGTRERAFWSRRAA